MNKPIFVSSKTNDMKLELIIVKMLLEDSNRAQCLAVMESTDGDLRAHAQARLKVLDGIQFTAQKRVYQETPPGMINSWEIRDWYNEWYPEDDTTHVDFHAIADGKKQEWYAYVNQQVETQL
jgi:hypothetical protein